LAVVVDTQALVGRRTIKSRTLRIKLTVLVNRICRFYAVFICQLRVAIGFLFFNWHTEQSLERITHSHVFGNFLARSRGLFIHSNHFIELFFATAFLIFNLLFCLPFSFVVGFNFLKVGMVPIYDCGFATEQKQNNQKFVRGHNIDQNVR
jgi:hypothetical protein